LSVEHAGTKENEYPVVLSNDKELQGYLAMLAGKPVYRGVQAEWIDRHFGFHRSPDGSQRISTANQPRPPAPSSREVGLPP